MSNVNSHPHGGSTQGGLKKTLGTWQLGASPSGS